ncbi:hemagglutinin repeat-containing protein [Acetonema longum]|uniref:Uncharacterized protein n=1 Tax=Acetonema longum DSM 6540 TaxID=1009370 RepID=F7NGC8_9FIRM|nr:hypothetical protein ALO_05558 [Acetonema longum DSM 6540]
MYRDSAARAIRKSTGSTTVKPRITAEKKLTVKSSHDINIIGGEVKGETVKVEAGVDLNLKSQQDRETYTEKNESTSGSIGVGVTGNAGHTLTNPRQSGNLPR